MIVEAKVLTPTKLSKKQKELLCQFDEDCREEQEEGFFSRLFHSHRGWFKKDHAEEKD